MKQVWVEQYRPRTLGDVIGQKEVVSRLQSYVKSGNLPHLLFAGPPGTGKTTSAMALARDLFKDDWQMNFYELNASDERGIGVVRKQIKDYARTRPMGDAEFKVIFLDEADALTDDAQAALRRTMERYTQTCRFVLSCNYSSKIIEPIQSRCAVFRFRPLQADDVKGYVRRLAKNEGLEVTKDGLEAIVYVARGDMRRVTNALQVAASLGKAIDADAVYQTTSTARPEEIRELITTALKGDFMAARNRLEDLLVTYGLSGEDVIRQIHRSIFDLGVTDPVKVRLVDRVGEAEFRLVEGSNERIQIEALLAHFVLAGGDLQD